MPARRRNCYLGAMLAACGITVLTTPPAPVSAVQQVTSSSARLAAVIRLAETGGKDVGLSGYVCASLGVGDGVKDVQVKQILSQLPGKPARTRTFNVVKDLVDSEGKQVILLADSQGAAQPGERGESLDTVRFYRTTPDGDYRVAGLGIPGKGVRLLSEAEALLDFYTEVDWWVKNAATLKLK